MGAKSKKKGQKRQKRILYRALAAAAVCIFALAGYLYGASRVLHVEYRTLQFPDLPAEFDGTTILFASDIDCVLSSTGKTAARLFDELAALRPDMLILGGDYASVAFSSYINGTVEASYAGMSEQAGIFLSSLADFPAPLGKYAVTGENDAHLISIAGAMQTAGIRLLENEAVPVHRGGAEIYIAGFGARGEYPLNADRASSLFESGDFVISVMHSPEAMRAVAISDAADGGRWCDLILSGHTHGGQVKLLGRTLVSTDGLEIPQLSGWFRDGSGAWALISPGVGCENINIRLGTESTVHFITLRKGADVARETSGEQY